MIDIRDYPSGSVFVMEDLEEIRCVFTTKLVGRWWYYKYPETGEYGQFYGFILDNFEFVERYMEI